MPHKPLASRRGLICDGCGCRPRKPAINLALKVYCARCAHEVGMDTGEHGEARTYDDWKRLAAEKQAAFRIAVIINRGKLVLLEAPKP